MKRINITTKERNAFNDVNNMVKKVMSSYYVNADGWVIPFRHVNSEELNAGIHYSRIQTDIHNTILHLEPGSTDGALVTTQMFYEGQRDHKQKIKGTFLNNANEIGFCNEAIAEEQWLFPFARRVDTTEIPGYMHKKIKESMWFEQEFNNSQYGLSLNDDLMEALLDGEVVEFQDSVYRARVTKKLFPQLNAKSVVSIRFVDHPVNNHIFYMIANVFKDDTFNTHVYGCLRF